MIDSAILVALIVAIPTVLASTFTPLAIAIIANQARRREKFEDYARQDLVAERAAQAADTLIESNRKMALQTTQVAAQASEAANLLSIRQDDAAAKAAEAAALLLRSNERVAESTKITNAKLDTIHTLVNSNMTAAMQAELDATVRERAVIIELVNLKKNIGQENTVEALAALKAAEEKIEELTAVLSDRLRA